MKKLIIAFVLIAFAVTIYVLSYKSAYARQVSPENTQEYQLVIFGISLPYNPTMGRIFTSIYSPLIERSASKIPTEKGVGAITRIDLVKSEVVISRDDDIGMAVSVPASIIESIRPFSKGETVQITYAMRPVIEKPFCYYFQLNAIAQSKK